MPIHLTLPHKFIYNTLVNRWKIVLYGLLFFFYLYIVYLYLFTKDLFDFISELNGYYCKLGQKPKKGKVFLRNWMRLNCLLVKSIWSLLPRRNIVPRQYILYINIHMYINLVNAFVIKLLIIIRSEFRECGDWNNRFRGL